MGNDFAIDTGIFDFGNLNFLSELPGGLGPQILKTRGTVPWAESLIWLVNKKMQKNSKIKTIYDICSLYCTYSRQADYLDSLAEALVQVDHAGDSNQPV